MLSNVLLKKKILIGLCGFISLALIIFFYFSKGLSAPAPNIIFNTTKGEQIALKSLSGKVVMVTFWATTCSSCVHEIPTLNTLYNELKPIGFELIAVAMPYNPPNQVLNMIEQRSIQYPVALDIQGQAILKFNAIKELPDIKVTPTSLLIDRNNQIVRFFIGDVNVQYIRQKVLDI